MALPAPTVATDPAPSAETNAAFVTLNGYVTDAYSELVDGLNAVREHIRITQGPGAVQMLDDLDAQLGTLSSSSLPNPAVIADPATQAQTNAALATMASYVDRLNTRSIAGTNVLREHMRRSGRVPELVAFDSGVGGILSTSNTAETVASDPVSLADMNTALANTTAFVDASNADFVNVLTAFIEVFRINPANLNLNDRLTAAVANLGSP